MDIGNCALWFDMGLGKTYTVISFALKLIQTQQAKYFMVLCPTTIFGTWEDELKKHIKAEIKYEFILAHGPKKKHALIQAKLSKNPCFICTSYETLSTIKNDLPNLDGIYLDESQKIKNPKAQRTRVAHEVARAHPKARIFCLSGTPSTKNLLGFYSQYEILVPRSTGFADYTSFEKHFSIKKLFMVCKLPYGKIIQVPADESELFLNTRKPPGQENTYRNLGYTFSEKPGTKTIHVMRMLNRIIGFKNIPDMHRITQAMAYTVKKKDVLTELPDKIPMIREIEMSPEQAKMYMELVETSKTTINNTPILFHDHGSVHAKLHQVANGFIRDKSGVATFFEKQPKIDALLDILEELGDEKLVVWSPSLDQLARLEAVLAEHDYETVTLTGSTSTENRAAYVRAFQAESGPQIFLSNPAAGGLGITLTRSCFQVFMANWYAPDVRAQAEDRQHRIGQKNSVTVVDLLTKGTLEKTILSNLKKSISIEHKVISMSELLGA